MSKNIFNIICKKCGGYCCQGGYEIFLTEQEIKKIKKAGKQFKHYKCGSGFLTKLEKKSTCVFLNDGVGCGLKKSLKPLDCDLFPLGFIYRQGKFEFYLIKECPYYKKISRKEAKKLKIKARSRLKKWSLPEIKTYSRLIAARKKSDLLEI